MAANSDMNSPIDATVHDVLNGCNQSCTSQQDSLIAQAQTEARKRVPAKKNETQNGVKVTFQIPKSIAVRLKKVAERVPATLADFGLLSLHFLGERTIQLANGLQLRTNETDTRHTNADSNLLALSAHVMRNFDSNTQSSRSTSNSGADERHATTTNGNSPTESSSRRSSNDAGVFVAPVSVQTNFVSPQSTPSLSDVTSPCTASTSALSVALVTTNGLKLRVRTAQITTPPACDADQLTSHPLAVTNNGERQTLNGSRHTDSQPAATQPRVGSHSNACDASATCRSIQNGSELESQVDRFDDALYRNGNELSPDHANASASLSMKARSKRGRELDLSNGNRSPDTMQLSSVPLNGKRPRPDDDASPNANHVHAHMATIGVNGVLQNGHSSSHECELEATQKLPIRSKPLNGVRCVTPRAVHAVSSATASDLS